MNFKNLYGLFILLFFLSCSKDIELQNHVSNVNLDKSEFFSGDCFSYDDFDFEIGELVVGYQWGKSTFVEYVLKPIGKVPIYFGEDYLTNHTKSMFRLIEESDELGYKRSYLMIVASNESDDVISTVSMINVPKGFTGELSFFNDQSEFVELRKYYEGSLAGRYGSNSCGTDLKNDPPNDWTGCYKVYNYVYFTTTVTTTTVSYDLIRIGSNANPNQTSYIDNYSVSTGSNSHTELLLTESWLCPVDDYVFIPIGDEVTEIGDRAGCISKANRLSQNGIFDPCRPELSPTELVLDLLGGNVINDYLSLCKDAAELCSNFEEAGYLSSNDSEVSDLLELSGYQNIYSLSEDVDLTICCGSSDFVECAILQLAQSQSECGQHEFISCHDIDGLTGICPSSFKFSPVGSNNYTADMSKVVFNYRGGITRTFYVGDLCINVPNRGISGDLLSESQAAVLMSEAWDIANDFTASGFVASGHTWGLTAYKNSFINNLKVAMLTKFSGTVGQSTFGVINSACSGNLPTSVPKYSFFC